jgi:hypothetical protein
MQVLNGAIEAQVEDGAYHVAGDAANPHEVFLALAKLADAQLILIDEERLTELDVELSAGDRKVLSPHIGEVHTATLLAVPRGLVPLVALIVSTDWAAELVYEDHDHIADLEPEAHLSPSQEAAAHQLANEQRFAEASYAVRIALLKRIAPDTLDPKKVIGRAEDIFELDVRPVREATLRAQALELLESGMAKGKVVAKLGLKNTYALNKLIGEA